MNILLEDFPEDLHQLIDVIGLEKMIEVCKIYGGCSVYLPKFDSLVRYDKSRRVVSEFNGKNARALMGKYGITYSQFKYMLEKKW